MANETTGRSETDALVPLQHLQPGQIFRVDLTAVQARLYQPNDTTSDYSLAKGGQLKTAHTQPWMSWGDARAHRDGLFQVVKVQTGPDVEFCFLERECTDIDCLELLEGPEGLTPRLDDAGRNICVRLEVHHFASQDPTHLLEIVRVIGSA